MKEVQLLANPTKAGFQIVDQYGDLHFDVILTKRNSKMKPGDHRAVRDQLLRSFVRLNLFMAVPER